MTMSVKRAALLALTFLGVELGSARNLPAQSNSPRGPAVVELYTSQGCSSCPPADALLGELSQMPNVLALAFHVDTSIPATDFESTKPQKKNYGRVTDLTDASNY